MKNKTTHNKIYRFCILLLIVFVYSCSQNSNFTVQEKKYLKNNRELTVAVYPYYAPYQYINEQGQIDGIFIDFMKLIEEKNKVKFKKIYYKNCEDVLTDAKKNKIDLILEIQKTAERSQYLNFFEPFFESQVVLVQKKGTKRIDGLKNFGNRKMVLPKKYSTVETIKNKYPNISISLENNDADCLKKVNDGEFDAFIGPRAVINYFIKKDGLNNLIITNTIDEKYTPSFATIKRNSLFTSIIQKNLNNITSKEKKSIIDNWLFDEIVPFYERTDFWLYVSSSILGLLLIFSSLSFYLKLKIKKRTFELNIAKEKAEESNRYKTALIQNISHEIRTPMNGIIGFTELLKNNDLQNEDRDMYLDIISKSTIELENSINNILDISQLETKQITINEEFVNVTDLFNEIHKQFLPQANKKKINLKLKTNNKNTDLGIKTDRTKLYKILTYLLDNAIKFTQVGFVNITYEVNQNSLSINIEDSGIGIDDNEKDAIFNSFSQSEKTLTNNYGGLGLGLYFAKTYTSLLKGKIDFTSSKNVGSNFNICFPNIETSQIKGKEIHIIKKEDNNHTFHILIAEDGDINYLLLQKILIKNPKYKFNITRAENGQETIELFKKNNFDLIFMDIKMPLIDGYEATKIIKKIKPELIIIAQTAFSNDEDIKKAFDAGCNAFLAKPIDILKLNSILDKYIGNQ